MKLLALIAVLVAGNARAETCAEQIAAYDTWLAPIKADVAKGALASDRTQDWVAIPLRKTTPPKQSAMTIIVDKDGLHDGKGPAGSTAGAAELIAKNVNIAWARSNKNAISRGIFVAATPDAPAASVKAAVTAAVAAKESVWLVFKPADGKAAAPPESSVTKDIATDDVNALVQVISREFAACPGLMTMMRSLGGKAESSRLPIIVAQPSAALAKCKCKTPPPVVASVMWKLAFANLGVLVAVPAKSVAKLPWGDATWGEAAPAVVKAL